jgi:hypothetical protein
MARKKKINVDVEVNNEVTSGTVENENVTAVGEVETVATEPGNEETAAVEGESMENETAAEGMVEDNGADVTENDSEENLSDDGAAEVPAEKKERRAMGSGSVWLMANGKYGWCVQLTSDRELKKLYGNKLRVLGSAVTYELASQAAQTAIADRDILLMKKLAKLGHRFDDDNSTDKEESLENEE